MQVLGFASQDKMFAPERLPNASSLLPTIRRPPDLTASCNALNARGKKHVHDLLSRDAGLTITASESLLGAASRRFNGVLDQACALLACCVTTSCNVDINADVLLN